jgi:lipopolysaccharide biosynthesis regulator YciM
MFSTTIFGNMRLFSLRIEEGVGNGGEVFICMYISSGESNVNSGNITLHSVTVERLIEMRDGINKFLKSKELTECKNCGYNSPLVLKSKFCPQCGASLVV